ncbi:hypothetical protein D9611_000478 [Ephemerocybe angulata]|uniref:PPM-type phosphatase domain-containing protein n=1 Tax=Ephemerocybe angulata TaxID=980116 RepID=A0A8H5F7D1_9AGAR|nr:hypothetical protein D9611_000478 [Tulosesus angulatus]
MPHSEIPPAPPRSGDRLKWVPYEDDYPDLVWEYTHLNEPELTDKFEELAMWGTLGDTDYATLQPCPNPSEASQDRHIIQDWDIDGKHWRFRGLFDGHGGHDTVNYTVQSLPSFLLERLARFVKKGDWTTTDISQLISQAIIDFDNDIGKGFLDLFPGNSIHESSDEQLKNIVNDPANIQAVLRCMRGTTVLIALVDPEGANLWVASLGDCTAILGTREPSGTWSTQTLSFNHNGTNASEATRVRLEHAGEERCMEDDRVLGAIAVTRAIGDYVFKLPAVYTQRGLLNCEVGFRTQRKVDDLLPRVLTPPYVSNVPQVNHISLSLSSKQQSNSTTPSSILMMYSDGLGDLYEDEFRYAVKIPGFWSSVVGKVMDIPGGPETKETASPRPRNERNAAMRFIRQGLGAEDAENVSRSLTTEYYGRWMDDTTVLVLRL